MSNSISARYFLFDDNDQLQIISRRVVNGLVWGTDRLPQFAGESLRYAIVGLRLSNGKPDEITAIQSGIWNFDGTGSIANDLRSSGADRFGLTESMSGSVVDRLSLDAARRKKQRRWKPNPAEITRLVHAIWPEQAGGRPVRKPIRVQGAQKRRYPVSFRAGRVRDECSKSIWGITSKVEDLSEHDLKGLLSRIDDEREETQEQVIWSGIRSYAELELEKRRQRRRKKGPWYAICELFTEDPNVRNLSRAELIECVACDNRDKAIAACREMLKRHANRFSHHARLETRLLTELEARFEGFTQDGVEPDGQPLTA